MGVHGRCLGMEACRWHAGRPTMPPHTGLLPPAHSPPPHRSTFEQPPAHAPLKNQTYLIWVACREKAAIVLVKLRHPRWHTRDCVVHQEKHDALVLAAGLLLLLRVLLLLLLRQCGKHTSRPPLPARHLHGAAANAAVMMMQAAGR